MILFPLGGEVYILLHLVTTWTNRIPGSDHSKVPKARSEKATVTVLSLPGTLDLGEASCHVRSLP